MSRGKPGPYPSAGSVGADEDGNLFYAVYPDYSGRLEWKPLQRWRWRLRRRLLNDLEHGDDSWIYQLETVTPRSNA